MKIVYSDGHRIHYPKNFLVSGSQQQNPEVPERADALISSVKDAGHIIVTPRSFGAAPRGAVHSPEYLEFLENIYTRWQRIPDASPEVIPNIHPQARGASLGVAGYPASAVGQAGYHMADTACPIGEGTWEAACLSADIATQAAQLILDGAPEAYALCRPPGHHAFADMAGGFCYLNNSAIAAQYLRERLGTVAVLDVDLHHGNGTQAIFYDRDDVLTISLHADPVRFYPFFWGFADERGTGRGLGYNFNLPLPRGTTGDNFLKSLQKATQRISAFGPSALVVALGLDAHEADPLAGLALTTDDFGKVARAIAALGLPTVLVQEGGYLTAALGDNLKTFLEGFAAGRDRAS
ncbi:histone deacetylase family protein [Limibacillus halophilus]|uniref:Acetoin utilization deacetylase AcuC-like enzyme n=1 Tax=Limibacillus halophilus TaxID=1579333 RepID=A0A839SRE4_9PROT|nr:histone deacetylase family protein [Limibacillus halophilus]MBB3065447.1 acetoin utilization deacetylase AcuC-like enzyme [Limibacillus halophilus]